MRFAVGLFSFIVFISACGSNAFAQKSDTDNQLKEANKLFEEGKYSEAYPLYTQLLSLRRGDPDITFKYGATSLYGSENKAEAISYLKKASLQPGIDIRCFYFLGKAYHLNYQFGPAVQSYTTFSEKADSKLKERYDVALSLQQCENGKELLSQIKEVIVLNRTDVDESDFFRYYELENLSGKILLAPEEFQSAEDKKRGHRPVIYTTPLSNIVYFSSYGKKGDQGLDIYYATRKGDGSWSEAILLPPPINTKYNEDYPFMSANGKVLYFCSEGHNSMGGYDIFRSSLDPMSGMYTTPENLDFAINTPDNDILYIADSLNQNAFFASARASKQDRMSVYEVKVDLIPSSIILIKGQFISEIDPGLKEARITIEDAQSKRQIGVFNTDKNAMYLVDFSYGGAYNFYVEAGNSDIIHSGKVEIPRLESMSAFRQELIMVDDNGVERLMIKNYFEEELEGNLQDLLAEALKRRADLQVTPKDQVAEMELQEDEAEENKEFKELYKTTGFSFVHSNEGVVDWAESTIEELRVINTEYKALANKALSEVTQAQEQADALIAQAQENYELFENSSDQLVKQNALRASITQRNDAKVSLLNASAAMMIYDRLSEASKEREENILQLQAEETKLKQALENNNENETSDIMSSLFAKEQTLKDDRAGGQKVLDYLGDVKEMEEMKSLQAYDEAEALRAEKNEELQNLKRLQSQLEKANAADKESIQNEIAETQASLEQIASELPEKWANYKELDWNDKVAEKSLLFANNWEYDTNDEQYGVISNQEFGLSLTTAKEEITAMENLENDALLALGMTYESLMKAPDEMAQGEITQEEIVQGEITQEEIIDGGSDIAAAQTDTKILIANEVIENYDQKVEAIRNNENRTDQLEAGIMLNAELVAALNQSIAANESSFSTEELEALKAEAEMETVILIEEYKQSIENQQEASYSITDIIPDYEEQIQVIQEYGGSDLEKKNQLLDFYNITIKRLDLILDSLSQLPVPEGDPFIFRQQIEYQNSVRILSTELKVKRYEVRENVELLSRVAAQPTADEMIDLLDPDYDRKYDNIMNSAEDSSVKEAQKIQLNESLIAKINSEIASLGRKMGQASVSEIPLINAKVDMLEGIISEKEQEINDAVLEMAKGNVSPDALISSNAEEEYELDETDRQAMTAAVYPNFAQEITAIEISDMAPADKVSYTYDVYEKLALSVDAKVFEVEENNAPDKTKWLALQRDINDELLAMSGYLNELGATGEEVVEENAAVQSDAEKMIKMADSWSSELSFQATTAAINSFTTTGKISDQPGFASESLKAESMTYYGAITDFNAMMDEYNTLDKSLAFTSVKEAKKIEKQLDQLSKELNEKGESLLIGWIPLLQIESETNGFDNSYLKLSKNAYAAAEYVKGEEKNRLLQESYLLGLMAMQEGQQNSIENNTNTPIALSRFSEEGIDFQSLTVAEKRLLLEQNINGLKEDIVSVNEWIENANTTGASEEEIQQFQIISKTYQEALVWNQSKLKELSSLEQDVIEIGTNQAAMIKAPTSPNALDQALNQIGLSDDQSAIIRDDPELQTYFAMQYVEDELNLKINGDKMMRASYIESGNEALENAMNSTKSDATPENAIASHQEIEKYYQDAITWYQKADSLDLMIKVLSDKKKDLNNNRTAYYEELEAINKESILAIQNGEVPEVLASNVTLEIEEVAVEEVLSEELIDEVVNAEGGELIAEEIVEVATPVVEETSIAENINIDQNSGDDESKGFMLEQGRVFYSAEDPIPVDPPLPQGLILKVQIGAFRNPLPPEHFVGLSPMTAEKLSNGITRYTVGIFREMDAARKARAQVQGIGYTDAFIIAYLNGERISLNKALELLGEEVPNALAAQNPLRANNAGNGDMETAGNAPATSVNTGLAENTGSGAEVGAVDVSSVPDLFFTVQVGVFSKKVAPSELPGIRPLNVELTGSGYYRYTSGRFATIAEAGNHKNLVVSRGISDAFVTAYYQGNRISLDKASALLEEDPSIKIDASEEIAVEEVVIEEEPAETIESEVIVETEVLPVNPPVSNLPDPSELTFVVFIGSYVNSIPNDVATALLENSDVGIKRAVNGGKMIYSTKELDSYSEASIVLQNFKKAGVEQAKMLYVLDGNEISEKRALEILAQ